VRHLLNHTAGWVGDLFTNTGDGDDTLEKYTVLVGKQKQITPLGRVWHYNNAAFGVAGRIIEVLCQKPFEGALEELLLKPLGLNKSNFFPHQAMLGRFAVGHYLDEHKRLQISQPWAIPRATAPIGRLNSSLREQLCYAKFCMFGNQDVLSDELRLEMQRPDVRGQLGDWFGIGWWLNNSSGEMVVSHGGATNGQMSAFWFVPSLGVACTILTNAEKGAILTPKLRLLSSVNCWACSHLSPWYRTSVPRNSSRIWANILPMPLEPNCGFISRTRR
jgi:CubicO group peptidase (beta-lactamase class C family)